MIQKTQSFQTSDGKIHSTISEAQRHEIVELIKEIESPELTAVDRIAEHLVNHQDRVVDILTTKATSKPKARAINGGRKVRTPKPSLPTAA